jgi:hypothetical protein
MVARGGGRITALSLGDHRRPRPPPTPDEIVEWLGATIERYLGPAEASET